MAKAGNFNATEDLFGNAAEYNDINKNLEPTMIDISLLEEFPNHPFRVIDDNQMELLANSIHEYGIKEPLWVIKKEMSDKYYVVAGHRRKYAAEKVGINNIPVNILDVDFKTATVLMVDSNNKREKLLISEKAYAYRMRHDALNIGQGSRIDLENESKEKLIEFNESNDSERTIRRYVRISYLSSDLINLVDLGKLTMTAGVIFSYFNQEEQELLFEFFSKIEKYPNNDQAYQIRDLKNDGNLSYYELEQLLDKKPVKKLNLTLKEEKLMEFFDPGTEKEEMEDLIISLLKNYFNKED